MGLTTRQDNTLNELFDKFALDPKKKKEKKAEAKEKKLATKNSQKNKFTVYSNIEKD